MPIRFSLPKPKPEWTAIVPEGESGAYLSAGYELLPKKRFGKAVLVKQKQPWERFEEELLLFLQHGLKLDRVNGGPACRIGGHQIDAMGGLENAFFVFECKSKKEIGNRSVRGFLRSFWVQKRVVGPALRKLIGPKYFFVHYVLVLRGITPSDRDLKYARSKNITIWSESYFDSLRALYLMIGERVRYYILKELGGSVPRVGGGTGKYFEFPVMANISKGDSVFSLFIPAKILLDLAYVLRIESGEKKAYQRFLDRGRLTAIARFLEDGNSFRNSILIGLDKKSKFRPVKSAWAKGAPFRAQIGILRVPRDFASAWVIDGQHRLYGYARADVSLLSQLLPVIAIKAKSKAEEANTFIQINQNQKPVNPNLIWALLGTLRPHSPEGLISSVVKRLAHEGSSIFRGKIYVPGQSKHSRKNYRIFHANFCKTISEHFVRGKRQGFEIVPDDETLPRDKEKRAENALFRNLHVYFSELCRLAEEAGVNQWKQGFFFTNNGINVLCRVLVQILKSTNGRLERASFRTTFGNSLTAYLRDHVNRIDHMRRFSSSEGSRDHEAAKIILAMAGAIPDFAESYLRQHRMRLEADEPYRLLKALEESFRKLIVSELEAVTQSWWKQRIPEDVRDNAQLRKEKRERLWPWLEAKQYSSLHYVDFTDYGKIISRKDNWRDAFEAVFRDKEAVVVKLRELEHVRNDIAHSRELSDWQMDFLRFNCRYLLSLIEGHTPKKAAKLAATVVAAAGVPETAQAI